MSFPEGGKEFPYAACPLYQKGDRKCCGVQHDIERANAKMEMPKKVRLRFLNHRRDVSPLTMEDPIIGPGSWFSRIRQTRELEEALQHDISPPLMNRDSVLDQVTSHPVVTQFADDCPMAKIYYGSLESNPAPPIDQKPKPEEQP